MPFEKGFVLRQLVLVIVISTFFVFWEKAPAQNPDPNHTHANFAVWIDGGRLDFSGNRFMSEEPGEEKHSKAGAPRHAYLHLHDQNDHVVHRHRSDVSTGDFLESLGFKLKDKTMQKSNVRIACVVTPDGRELCNGEKDWLVMLNDEPYGCRFTNDKNIRCDKGPSIILLWNYVFVDGDKILLSYDWAWNGYELERQYTQMTDDACLYSRTCPWKGRPPVESCIAHPEVPCTVQ